ncbi:hypothetical protein [Segniliparus rugosus]|uniref:Uncharacterized protein n=1 Tax=Segniliparus rugosus (strain ATCC BAA-974 / DSM 45345 / CCUG 50838 / CIP 108380 / JCM 13579 / CDC 945) TaxID=679197 RepID=E5XQ84_SEGRC|nr:hypothetical protein [Segniliparus rugosus]EFV13493.2 hypothetical protein HMPREF9336_01656 [Segniliparus rugosus ATCC BAA-974]
MTAPHDKPGAHEPLEDEELLRVCEQEAPKVTADGEPGLSNGGRGKVIATIVAGNSGFGLTCTPVLGKLAFEDELILKLGTARTADGRLSGHLLLMTWIEEAIKDGELKWAAKLNRMLHKQPPKRMTADDAWWARDMDVWEGVSEREFKEQWLASQPKQPDDVEQLELDRKADRARLDAATADLVWDPAKILETPVGERVPEEISRILEYSARETARLLEARDSQFTASDDDKTVMVTVGSNELTTRVWLSEDALRRHGSRLQDVVVDVAKRAKAGMRQMLEPRPFGE